MSSYPDLGACDILSMKFSLHVSGGLEEIDAFWAARGLDRGRERLLFAGYTRGGRKHTVYLQWSRSHEGCSDVSMGVESRPPSAVWPHRPLPRYRLRPSDFRDFIGLIREMEVPWGIRARYTYPSKPAAPIKLPALGNTRLASIAFEVMDETSKPALRVTRERHGEEWWAIVEPTKRFPFPEGDDFFSVSYATGCSLAAVIREEPLKTP